MLELAGAASKDLKKSRIGPRHIQLAVHNDDEFSQILGSVTISAGGVMPRIEPVLLPKAKGKKAAATDSQEY